MTVWLWDSTNGRNAQLPSEIASAVIFSPDGTRLAVGSDDRVIKVMEVSDDIVHVWHLELKMNASPDSLNRRLGRGASSFSTNSKTRWKTFLFIRSRPVGVDPVSSTPREYTV